MGKNHKKIIIAASGAVAMALSLCACQVGGSTSAPAESKAASDTITMMNYPDWIGENEASAFKDETGYTLKQVSTPDGGDSAWVNIIRQNSGSYDMSLAGMKVAETLDNAGLLEEFDASEVPNLKNIDSQYTEAFPWGIPVEQGKIGIIYNKELVSNPPTSWKELFEQAASYSGKLLMPSYSSDVIDVALPATGHDVTPPMWTILKKPSRPCSISSNMSRRLRIRTPPARSMTVPRPSRSFTTTITHLPKPTATRSDGCRRAKACLHTSMDWVPLKGTANLDKVYKLMDFHLEKTNYADFINTTQASWIMQSVTDSLDESLTKNEALNPETAGKTIYGTLQSAEIQQAVASAWQEIQNS